MDNRFNNGLVSWDYYSHGLYGGLMGLVTISGWSPYSQQYGKIIQMFQTTNQI